MKWQLACAGTEESAVSLLCTKHGLCLPLDDACIDDQRLPELNTNAPKVLMNANAVAEDGDLC